MRHNNVKRLINKQKMKLIIREIRKKQKIMKKWESRNHLKS